MMRETSPFAVVFRTHFWDEFAQRQFDRLLPRCAGCDVFILVDETAGKVQGITHDRVLRHTETDVLAIGLPRAGEGNLLWFNGDYPLYLFVDRFPAYTHILQLEYDVTVNCALGGMLARMRQQEVDFVGFAEPTVTESWPWLHTCRDAYPADKVAHRLICLSAYSAPALHYLAARRRLHAARLRDGTMSAWPMCEAFIATELAMGGYKSAELTTFGTAFHYDHWPPFLEDDLPDLADSAFIHPVLDRPRYIASLLKYHVGVGGYLHPFSLFHRKLRRLPLPSYVQALASTAFAKLRRNMAALKSSHHYGKHPA